MTDTPEKDTVMALIELVKRKAPELLDLITAETDDQFENAFTALLEKVVSDLEINKKHFFELSEDALTAILAIGLRTFGLSVTQQAHSNGHVDITITADHCLPARKKLGEAKIWDGPKYHIEGLKQLLERYTTGREGRGMVIAYFRVKNIAGLMAKLRERMNKERPYGQTTDAVDYVLKWSFVSSHEHSCGETLEVGHIGCNLCTETGN